MNKILFVLIFTTLSSALNAQSDTGVIETIRGKVINKATNEAIPFTNISIEDSFHGTASDGEGNFELKIPGEMVNDRIHFSAVGYKNEIFPVKRLFNREFNIVKLEPKSYDIEDIDIAARSKVLIRIVRMASENTPYNFIGGPFNLVCSYENKKIIDDTTEVSQTAEILLFDKTGYTHPTRLNSYQMRRYIIDKTEPDYRFSSGILNLDEMLETDWVRSGSSVLNPSLLDHFDLTLENETEVDGDPAWIISFSQSNPTPEGSVDFHATSFAGKITIKKEDYSVKKIEGAVQSEKHNRQGKSLAVGNTNANYYEDVSYNFAVTYSQLKPDVIAINKAYLFNGRIIEERSKLKVEQVKMTGLNEISERNYFAD